MNLFKRYKTTKREAVRILDGVIAISEAEQLIHGTYLTPEIVNKNLRGNICGGRQACLIGSVALAAAPGERRRVIDKIIDGLRYNVEEGEAYYTYQRSQGPVYRYTKRHYPAALRAMDALNAEAAQRLKGKYTQRARDAKETTHNIAESYFETYLLDRTPSQTHRAIVSLCEAAKKRV